MDRIQSGDSFSYRVPYATIALCVLLIIVYLMENHPHTGLHPGEPFMGALSEFNLSQLASELVLLGIGGSVSEQFISRDKIILFELLVGSGAVAFIEYIHPNMLDLGISGGSVGLVTFASLCVLWYVLNEPESFELKILISAFVVFCVFLISTTLYGVFVHSPANIPYVTIYKPETQYIAHLAGAIAGWLWWIAEHEMYGTE